MPPRVRWVLGTILTRPVGSREREPVSLSRCQARLSKLPATLRREVPSPAQASSASAWRVRTARQTSQHPPWLSSSRGTSLACSAVCKLSTNRWGRASAGGPSLAAQSLPTSRTIAAQPEGGGQHFPPGGG